MKTLNYIPRILLSILKCRMGLHNLRLHQDLGKTWIWCTRCQYSKELEFSKMEKSEIAQLHRKAEKSDAKAIEYEKKALEFYREAAVRCSHPKEKVISWNWINAEVEYCEAAQCTQCGLRDTKYKFLPRVDKEERCSNSMGPAIAQETYTVSEWR